MRRNPMLWMSVAAMAAFALAGCTSGGGGGSADTSGGVDVNVDDDSGLNGSVNVTAPNGQDYNGSIDTGNKSFSWTVENRTGTIDAGNAPSVMKPEAAEEGINVSEGTEEMYLNLSVEGGDVMVLVMAPGCTDEGCAQTDTSTEDKSASFHFMQPDAGEWNVEIRYDDDAVVLAEDSEFDLGIAQLAMTQNGNASAYPPSPPY